MNIRALVDDDDAVSPVIGVILMVAITVILAAVIASFVLGLGEEAASTTPQASFGFDYNNESGGDDVLTVTHESGDTIQGDNVDAAVSDAIVNDGGTQNDAFWDGDLFGSEVTAGDSDSIEFGDFVDSSGSSFGSGNLDISGSTVRVVYQDPSNDQSSTLQTWTGPEA